MPDNGKMSIRKQNQQSLHIIEHARVEKYCWHPTCPPQRPRMPCYGIYCPRLFVGKKPKTTQSNTE
jgi:hypothetical protein